MFDNLQSAEFRYEEINHKLSDPSIINNHEEYRKLLIEHSDLEPIIFKYKEYKKESKDSEEA